MSTPHTVGRFAKVLAAAAVLTVSAAGLSGAAGRSPNPGGQPVSAPVVESVADLPGAELEFVLLPACRFFDTRVAGGVLTAATRTFTAVAPYAAQGGNPAGCDIPSYAVALVYNLTASSQAGSKGYVKAWAGLAAEPSTSVLQYNTSGAVANMITVPVSPAPSSLKLKTNGSAHLWGDVAGYYVKPLYAAIDSGGGVYSGIRSGLVSSTRLSPGIYELTFNRSVRTCAAATNDIIFASTHDVSADVGFNPSPNTVTVRVTNSTDALADTYFSIILHC